MIRKTKSAFTLLEVMLAVALSAFLMAMIAQSINLSIFKLQETQKQIERSQIARNILMMIKSDIRAAIQYKPSDVTGLDSLTVSQAAIAGVAADAGIDPSLAAGAAGGAPREQDAEEDPGIGSGQTEVLRPGLYGSSTEIMIDVSRLPRVDQYDPLVVGSNPDQSPIELPTDVKTISYFVSEDSLQTSELDVGQNAAVNGGLYRRKLDRAVAAYSSNLAVTLAALGNTELIANEVIGIQFRYFDGEDWVESWDSDEKGGFPAAVEVTILVDNERTISKQQSYSIQDNPQSGESWRTVINLPAAEILSEEELEIIANGGAP